MVMRSSPAPTSSRTGIPAPTAACASRPAGQAANAGTTNHWLVLYKHSLLKPDIELTPVSDRQRQEMKLLEKRFRDMIYTKGKVTEKEAETIRKKYDLYQITYKDGQVSGVPIFMVRASEAYERMIPDWDKDMLTKMGIEMRAYFDLMKRIAVAYNNSEAGSPVREEMKRKFLAMYDHITDQGNFSFVFLKNIFWYFS